jgi:hypothetical protein
LSLLKKQLLFPHLDFLNVRRAHLLMNQITMESIIATYMSVASVSVAFLEKNATIAMLKIATHIPGPNSFIIHIIMSFYRSFRLQSRALELY